MPGPRFASVRNLFNGTALATPPEDDAAEQGNQGKDAPAAGPTPQQVDSLVASEVEKATAAANDRWNTVMTSDAGAANPKAAARMLCKSPMAADDIVATLEDLGGSTPAARAAAASQAEADAREADRAALAADADAQVDTGAAGGRPSERRGEGTDKTADIRAARAARAEKRNKAAEARGGKKVNG